MSLNNPNIKADDTKVPVGANSPAAPAAVSDNSLNEEYIDKRTVVISLVHNYSNYRKVNLKVLGQRKEVIGSSVNSCRILSSNQDEVEAYFPALIGLSPNHPDFITRVKSYLSNISFAVNENDVPLNISFIYKKKSDYLAIKKQEDAIEDAYAKVDRSNITAIKEALKKRIDALNTLESSKYQYGNPQDIEQYIIYRHCLLYPHVAKDMALINSDPNLRFYIKDEAKEEEKRRKLLDEKKKAMRNFLELDASESKFNSVYINICVLKNEDVKESILRSKPEKNNIVMNFVNEQPDKFNKLFADKHLSIKAFIERLISVGELVRSDYNQQITTAEGEHIGANMTEAIAYFSAPNNADTKAMYESKLNLI